MKSQRMYCIAMRHLSGIQKGIQSLHAVVEYGLKFGNTPEYQRWAKTDKTVILLECGTTELLEKTFRQLRRNGVKIVKFHEPDLNDSMTAIAFLLDETVWNVQKYPETADGSSAVVRNILSKFNLASN